MGNHFKFNRHLEERLVEKGYNQSKKVDFDKIFSSISMTISIRILLAIVARYDYQVLQIDVNITFLNKNFEEEMYMIQLDVLRLRSFKAKCASFRGPFIH